METNGLLSEQTTGNRGTMTSVENSIIIQSDMRSPKTETHVHQLENESRDPAALVPEMADMNHMIDADSDDGNNNSDQDSDGNHGPGIDEYRVYLPPPGIEDAWRAYEDIQKILKSNQKRQPGLDSITQERLEQVCQFLWTYVDPKTTAHGGTSGSSWQAASQQTAHALGRGIYLARNLRKWARAFIIDREDFPGNSSGWWNEALLDNEVLVREINQHLQGIGKYAKALDIVKFLDTPEMKERLDRTTTIHLTTAKRWMHKMGYRWTNAPKGQYVDGHEREDVVAYQQDVFLPKLAEIDAKMRKWTADGIEDPNTTTGPDFRHTVVWYHNESIFYANDRRMVQWVPENETAVPRAKGEGASLMVADFVSADYGWLRSPSRLGEEDARVLLKIGKSWEGYFTNEDVLKQTQRAMDILQMHHPNEDHILVFDNAPSHLKRPDEALSARNMPKFTPKEFTNWGPETTKIGEDGKPVYGPNGKVLRTKIQMADATFANGTPQKLYFPPGHPRASIFKGMSVLLKERGLLKESDLKAQCKDFKCKKGATDCCCRRVLYSQPDFALAESKLETLCKQQGFDVLFLPKFHCELNFIEQCWGKAKWTYRNYPASSTEADLERNLVSALESVPLHSMQR